MYVLNGHENDVIIRKFTGICKSINTSIQPPQAFKFTGHFGKKCIQDWELFFELGFFFHSNFSRHSLYYFFFGLFWVRRFQYCSKFSDTLITGALRRCQIICLQCLFDFLHYLFSRASVLDSNFAPNSKKRYFYDAPSLTCWIIKSIWIRCL